jgi:hypothetical protein
MLELPMSAARNSLEDALSAKALSKDFLALFPFEDIVITGLQSHSGYWSELAIEWAKKMLASPRVTEELEATVRQGPTQRVRHAAQKLLASHKKTMLA